MSRKSALPPVTRLRALAEAEFAPESSREGPAATPEALPHELLVQQTELQLRNEELRYAQVALAESQQRFTDLYEFAPVGYLTLNEQGLVEDANLTSANLLREDRARLPGSLFERFVAADDQANWLEKSAQAFQRHEKWACELRLRCADGTVFDGHLDLLLAAGRDAPPTLRIALTDITERHQAEEALRSSHALNSAILDAVSPEIAVLDHAGVIVAVNQAWRRFAMENGLEPGKPPPFTGVGTDYLAVCQGASDGDPEGIAAARQGIEAVMAGKSAEFKLDYPCDSPTQQRWFHMSVTPLRRDSGSVVVTHTDITELRQAMAELWMAEERLRLAKSVAGLGIYDRDLVSGILAGDASLREFWGFAAEESLSLAQIFAGIHPDDRRALQAAIDRASDPAGAGELQAEYRVISRRDGRERWIAAHGKILFRDGRPVRSIGTVKDISEQKRLDAELQERRSAMDRLARQQVAAQTAGAIAHELNQPLVSVSAYSEAALAMLHGGIKQPEKLEKAIAGAAEQAQRAGHTLHELLDFLYKGGAPSMPVDLNEVVQEALRIVGERGYRGFRCFVDTEPGLPPVMANRIQVEKVVVNLLQNSLDAMGDAEMQTPEITLRLGTDAAGNMAQVSVQDNGRGFDPETVRRIFDPFFTTKSDGVGLGLAISRALIEAHGGKLWAETGSGSGATFHFTLPFAA